MAWKCGFRPLQILCSSVQVHEGFIVTELRKTLIEALLRYIDGNIRDTGVVVCIRNAPIGSDIEYLVPCWWCCLGGLQTC